ncbi:hypothetical protein FHT70_003089 [Rhizobium sp. BK049]|nr:hypothetical protein [Rhizobium sp. BK049]
MVTGEIHELLQLSPFIPHYLEATEIPDCTIWLFSSCEWLPLTLTLTWVKPLVSTRPADPRKRGEGTATRELGEGRRGRGLVPSPRERGPKDGSRPVARPRSVPAAG